MLTLVSVGGAGPAAGAPPESFNELFQSFPISVNGSYTPLVGQLDCIDGGQLAVIWYAAGSRADWWWKGFAPNGEGGLDHFSAPLSVNGSYEPFVGDFDGDGCDDVFWYAPGPVADFVWYGVDGGGFTTRAVTVNGDYTPLVGTWDGGAVGDDIFWYGSGGGTESIWRGTTTRGTFVASAAPQVIGTDFLAAAGGDGALFYRPGPGADYVWGGNLAGASAPAQSFQTAINGTYQPHPVSDTVLLYAPGPAQDQLLTGFAPDRTPLTIPGTIHGTFRVAGAPATGVIVFHAPGSAPDYLWLAGKV